MLNLLPALMLCSTVALTTTDDETIAARLNEFAFELQASLADDPSNTCVSPFSVASALYLLHAGARSSSATALERTLRITESTDLERTHKQFAQHVSGIVRKDDRFEIALANALWGQNGYEFDNNGLKLLADVHTAPLRRIDFTRDAAEGTINDWIEANTAGRVRDMIVPESLPDETRLVLTNALYFKAEWLKRFKESETKHAPFQLQDGSTVQVPTMRVQSTFGYAKTAAETIVRLPFRGEYSLIVALPDSPTPDALSKLERSLDQARYAHWLTLLVQRELVLSLPRFTFETEAPLADALRKMELDMLFDGRADLSGLGGAPGELRVSQALHKTFLALDENGCEAAAATAVVAVGTAISINRPLPVSIDRPFWFAIADNRTGQLLFCGHVTNPAP